MVSELEHNLDKKEQLIDNLEKINSELKSNFS